jgi:CheY-like chemotaxis protein
MTVRRVLIADSSAESREVLRLLLELCGVRTLEAEHSRTANRLVGQFQPDVIVFDAETEPDSADAAVSDIRQATGRNDRPIVILGKVRQLRGPPTDQFVAKPYHYGPLIRKIHGLLDAA